MHESIRTVTIPPRDIAKENIPGVGNCQTDVIPGGIGRGSSKDEK